MKKRESTPAEEARIAARDGRSKAKAAVLLRLVDLDGGHGPATPGEKRAAKAAAGAGDRNVYLNQLPEWVCPGTLKALAALPGASTIVAGLLGEGGNLWLTPLSSYGAKAPLPGGEVEPVEKVAVSEPAPVDLLGLIEKTDGWLAWRAAKVLEAMPVEEIILVETEEVRKEGTFVEVPVERRYRGRQLFRITVPADYEAGSREEWSAALLKDGRLLIWQDHVIKGTVLADIISPDATFEEATRQPFTIHPLVWAAAMRLLGKRVS